MPSFFNKRIPVLWVIVSFFMLVFSGIFVSFYFSAESQKQNEKKKLIPTDWLFRQRAFPYGKIDRASHQEALLFVKNQRASTPTKAWDFCGPDNIGGRITDIELTENTVFVGSASGGIFKSSDLSNWIPVFDSVGMLSIGDLAIAPSDTNIVYAGTGEPNGGISSQAGISTGVYKSIDGGMNWFSLGLENSGSIGKIIVNPQNPDICYVASLGPATANGGDRGIYKTLNGGESWEQVLWINDSTGFVDLVMHPTQFDTIYAAAWQRRRSNSTYNYGGASSGIYRTYDGGQTWEELSGAFPDTAGRIGITIAPSSPNILYASVTDAQTQYLEGVYRSSNHGDTWIRKSTEGIYNAPFNYWFGKIYAHPDDAYTLYIGALYMHKSTDGGGFWEDVFWGVHVDQHALAFDPNNPEEIYIGNDGGLYFSSDGGENFEKINGLPITQFYTCEIDYMEPERLYGGTQDNSSMRTATGGVSDWEIISFGDGFYNLVDPTNNSIIYTEYQYGGLQRSEDGGVNWVDATSGIDPEDRKNWNTPVVFNPSNPQELYYGAHRLYKSEDRAQTWNAISPDLTDGSSGGNLVFNTITTISVSPLNEDIIITGTDDGNVSITEDGGTTWENISSSLPKRWVTSVTTDNFDVNVLYVTLSGYEFNDHIGHVYKSSDLGHTWTDISGNLPDVPINKLLSIKSDLIVIATDVGVFQSRDQGLTWNVLGGGAPAMFFTDMDYHPPTNKLVAATFGRGMYSIAPDTTPVTALNKLKLQLDYAIYPNPTKGKIYVNLKNAGAGLYKVEVFSQFGQLMQSSEQNFFSSVNHRLLVDLTDLPAGNYIISLSDSENKFRSNHLVVRF